MQAFGRNSGNALELGSFAGGISIEIARLYPQINLTIADERTDYLEFLKNEMIRAFGQTHQADKHATG